MPSSVSPHCVSRECGDLRHARVPPHDDLVQRVAVRADDLVDVLRPHEVAHLCIEHHTPYRAVAGETHSGEVGVRSTAG